MCPRDSAANGQGSFPAASDGCSPQPGGAWAKGSPLVGGTSWSSSSGLGSCIPSQVPLCIPQLIESLATGYAHSSLAAIAALRMGGRCRSGGKLEPGHAALAGSMSMTAFILLEVLQSLERNGFCHSSGYSYLIEQLPEQLWPVMGSMYAGSYSDGEGMRLDVSSMACCSVCGVVVLGKSHVCQGGGAVPFMGFQQSVKLPSYAFHPLSFAAIEANVKEVRALGVSAADSADMCSYGICPVITSDSCRPGIDKWVSPNQKQPSSSQQQPVSQQPAIQLSAIQLKMDNLYDNLPWYSEQERDRLVALVEAAMASIGYAAMRGIYLLPRHTQYCEFLIPALDVVNALLTDSQSDTDRLKAFKSVPYVVRLYDVMQSQQQQRAFQRQQMFEAAAQPQPLTPRQSPAMHHASSSSSSSSCSPSSAESLQAQLDTLERSIAAQREWQAQCSSRTDTAVPSVDQGSAAIEPQPAYRPHVQDALAGLSISPYVPNPANLSTVQGRLNDIQSSASYHFAQAQFHSNMYRHCCSVLTESQGMEARCMQLLDEYHQYLRQQLQQQEQSLQHSQTGSPTLHVPLSHEPSSSATGFRGFRS